MARGMRNLFHAEKSMCKGPEAAKSLDCPVNQNRWAGVGAGRRSCLVLPISGSPRDPEHSVMARGVSRALAGLPSLGQTGSSDPVSLLRPQCLHRALQGLSHLGSGPQGGPHVGGRAWKLGGGRGPRCERPRPPPHGRWAAGEMGGQRREGGG